MSGIELGLIIVIVLLMTLIVLQEIVIAKKDTLIDDVINGCIEEKEDNSKYKQNTNYKKMKLDNFEKEILYEIMRNGEKNG